MSESSSPPLSWRAHLLAGWITFHLVCVTIYVLPYPPLFDEAALEHPEVAAELKVTFENLHQKIPLYDSPQEMQQAALGLARGYIDTVSRGREWVEPYLRWTGSTQSWTMFGGTPPRYPLVLVVEVRPRGSKEFVLYQDLRWGTEDSAAMNFRHRKVHENLSMGWGNMAAYSAYWARRWNEQHPERPAQAVRLSYIRSTTPLPEAVRAGNSERHPTLDILPYVWEPER